MTEAALRALPAGSTASAAGAYPVGEQLAPVIANSWVNAEYKHLVLACDGAAARAAPGQFFHLLCPAGGAEAPYLRRPMSVYRADPAAGRLEFLYKVTGAGTRAIASLEPGDPFDILGPLGTGFDLAAALRHIVVVGRGVGLATLAPLAACARERGIGVTAILSARRPELLMSVALFREAGAEVVTVTDSEGTSGPASVERLLHGLIAAGSADAFFTCGSNRLMQLMKRLGGQHGIPGQVAMEQVMACGLGPCYVCVRTFEVNGRRELRRVCIEGPVFNLQEAVGW
jgi:dihydroorotate dehydrogenase electron transfer subunit